jgi:hypothetical protein
MQQIGNLIPARLGDLLGKQSSLSAAIVLSLNRVDPNRIAKQKLDAAIDNGRMPATAVEQGLCRIKEAEKLQWGQVVPVFIGGSDGHRQDGQIINLCAQSQMGKTTMESAELIGWFDLNHWLRAFWKYPYSLT